MPFTIVGRYGDVDGQVSAEEQESAHAPGEVVEWSGYMAKTTTVTFKYRVRNAPEVLVSDPVGSR